MDSKNHLKIISPQIESCTMPRERGLYTSVARSCTSFLQFHESPPHEYSPSLSPFWLESSPSGSGDPRRPTPRPLTVVAGPPLSSPTTYLRSDSGALHSGNEDYCSLRDGADRVFTRQAPPLHGAWGGIFRVIAAPHPSGANRHSFPGQGPVYYHQVLTETRLGYEWGGGLRGNRGRECGKSHPAPGR